MRRLFNPSSPRQFWLMFVGMLISTIGSSMIWPFLMIYVSERLGLPLTFTALLLTLNSGLGLISLFICGLMFYGLLLAFKARETLPELHPEQIAQAARDRFGGYGKVLADKPYRAFVLSFLFTQFSASILWVMLSVYTKTNFALPESRYGLIPMTNALMVVAFQIPVTMWTKQQKPHTMMALGAFFYAIGVGSVALAGGFWGFWLSMVIMTIGELVLVPTTSTYAANLAPAHMRGRYMSIYGLTWNVAHGTGPVVGGLLNDTFGPRSMSYGGGGGGLISTALFMLLARTREKEQLTGPIEDSPG